jgi:hypothetical protein
MKKNAIILIILLGVGFSCSIQKRIYLSSYHLTRENNKSSIQNKDIEQNYFTNNDLASDDEFSFKIIKNNTQLKNEECDLIILNNGDDISAKVVEITTTEIKYKKCENINGPIYSIQKSEVFTIRYSNGSKEIIKSSSNNSSENTMSNYEGSFVIWTKPPFANIDIYLDGVFQGNIGVTSSNQPSCGNQKALTIVKDLGLSKSKSYQLHAVGKGLLTGEIWNRTLIFEANECKSLDLE